MCSIGATRTAIEGLASLARSGDKVAVKLAPDLTLLAEEASAASPGKLDRADTLIQHLPEDLRQVRKTRVGRHRVFFTGQHTDCHYRLLMIKPWKKTGTLDEGDKRTQQMLRKELAAEDYVMPSMLNLDAG